MCVPGAYWTRRMNQERILACAAMSILLFPPTATRADVGLTDRSTVVFATTDKARDLLTQRDEFVRRMSPFDRAARLKTDRAVPEDEYLRFAGLQALEWTADERTKLAETIESVRPRLADCKLPLPATLYLVKTSGNEEGGAAYTRGDAIMLPERTVVSPGRNLKRLFCHELFHVLSRQNSVWRDRLYATIGFHRNSEIPFPAALETRRITNPDAPFNAHFIRVRFGDQPVCAVPILYARSDYYDPKDGGEFFRYAQFRLLLLIEDAAGRLAPANEDGQPKLVGVNEVTGFFEQVGRNTSYLIHPEEILADNFSLLIVEPENVRSPEILDKMRAVLSADPPRAGSDRQTMPREE